MTFSTSGGLFPSVYQVQRLSDRCSSTGRYTRWHAYLFGDRHGVPGVSNLGNPLLTVNYQLQPSVPGPLGKRFSLNIPGGSAGNIIFLFDKTGRTLEPIHPTCLQTNDHCIQPFRCWCSWSSPMSWHMLSGTRYSRCIGTSITLSAGSYAVISGILQPHLQVFRSVPQVYTV
jgi:hypothetical protein